VQLVETDAAREPAATFEVAAAIAARTTIPELDRPRTRETGRTAAERRDAAPIGVA